MATLPGGLSLPTIVFIAALVILAHRIYFELNGNVYTGSLTKDGAPMGGGYYVSNPGGATVTDRLTFLPFYIRMNKAAHDSLAAAMAI